MESKKNFTTFCLIIAPFLLAVYLLLIFLDLSDMGLTLFCSLAAILLVAKIRWELRTRIWFWIVMALHVPLIVFWHWPDRWTPTVELWVLVMADISIILGVLRVAERLAGPKGGGGIHP
jgi:hypothetical protein